MPPLNFHYQPAAAFNTHYGLLVIVLAAAAKTTLQETTDKRAQVSKRTLL